MLAVCSDLDGSTLRIFYAVHRYLNTDLEDTYLGKGLGLDISDSFWMFCETDIPAVIDFDGSTSAEQLSYFGPGALETGNKSNNEEIIKFFKSGWIDSIHSYGDFSRTDESKPVFTKEHAELANEEMLENSILPAIWINHGNSANVQNLGKTASSPKLSYQQGGDPVSPYYHADFTIAAGIKYVWFSNPSSAFAVDTPLYPAQLKDGQKVWGFNRYTGDGKFIRHKYNWSSYSFSEQVSEKHLKKLVSSGGVAVVAQHFGASNGDYIFTGETKSAFERLKRYEDNGDILVARTSRLLEYVRTRDNLNYSYSDTENGEEIRIYSIDDPVLGYEKITSAEQLRGICFNVKNPENTVIYLGDDTPVDSGLLLKSEPGAANSIIGFKWYEKDFTDYTAVDIE